MHFSYIFSSAFYILSLTLIVSVQCCLRRVNKEPVVLSTNTIGRVQERLPLRFNSNGTFKIVNFADLHYGEAPETDWGPASDRKSTKVLQDILNWENPDFVVFTGDQITGENMYPNGSEYIHILLEPLVQGGYKWASVYGNHDIGPNVTRLEILQAEQQYFELCYTQKGPSNLPGETNYYLPVYGADAQEDIDPPATILWFFDSRGGKNSSGELPHNVDPKVVEWFVVESQKLNDAYGLIPALAFFHIPTTEFEAVQEQLAQTPACTGLVDDDVTPQDQNTGLLEALVNSGTVQTAFVGHDHGNAWCCYYKTLEICYNRHTGYGGYGTWVRGARVIQLEEAQLKFQSVDDVSISVKRNRQINYIRLENGTIIDGFPKTGA